MNRQISSPSLQTTLALFLCLLLLAGCNGGGGDAGGTGNTDRSAKANETNGDGSGEARRETDPGTPSRRLERREPNPDRTLLLDEAGNQPARPRRSLYDAAIHGDVAQVKANIFWDADVNALAPDGFTALHGASRNNYPEIVELLLQFGADPNIVANPHHHNVTPIHWAIRTSCYECVELLIQYGADVNKPGGIKGDIMPLALASERGDRRMALLLADNGARE